MEVILLERVEKLGQMGDVVNVKPGYARNYLLPQNKALRATEENRRSFEERRSELEAVNAERRSDAEGAARDIDGMSVILVRQASDTGQLYGSVRPRDIANALAEKGAPIDRTQVRLDQPIKTIGLHTVRVAVHPEVVVDVIANVARSEDEAALQAQGKSVLGEDEEEEELAEAAAEAEAASGIEAEADAGAAAEAGPEPAGEDGDGETDAEDSAEGERDTR